MRKYAVTLNEEGQSLFNFVRKVLKGAPISISYKLFRKKDVKVNGHWQDEKYLISEGEEIAIYLPEELFLEFEQKASINNADLVKSWIVYEDENILVVNKPRGVLVQKALASDTALDGMVISYLIEKGEYDPKKDVGYTPAPTHRLDRNTAGIVVFGKSLKVLQELASIMPDKDKVEKKYVTLVKGHVEQKGRIDKPLYKNGTTVYVDLEKGKESITEYSLIEHIGDYSLLEVHLLTGRTHQIRVHFASIDHPVVGDSKYGSYPLNKEFEQKYGFKNQFLMASYLCFHHLDGLLSYLNNKPFTVELAKEYVELLTKLKDNK